MCYIYKKMIAQLLIEIAHISKNTNRSYDSINIFTQEKFIESYVSIEAKLRDLYIEQPS